MIYFVFILCLGILPLACEHSPDSYEYTYILQTIDGKTIEEYAKDYPGLYEWPVEITLIGYSSGDEFKGVVLMAKAGELPIKDDTRPKGFSAYFVEVIDGIEYIGFGSLNIDIREMKGKFGYWGPTIEPWIHEFSAIRK